MYDNGANRFVQDSQTLPPRLRLTQAFPRICRHRTQDAHVYDCEAHRRVRE